MIIGNTDSILIVFLNLKLVLAIKSAKANPKIVDEIADSSDASNAINNSFKNVFEYINAIDTSLYIAIQENNPNVELLYESLFDLVKYFSVDAASILSVTVFPTDNDGD